MSNQPRTSQAIQQEFNNVAFRAGHLQNDIYNKEKDLKMFNETLSQLQTEYNVVKQQEDAVAKAAADAKAQAEKAATAPKEAEQKDSA